MNLPSGPAPEAPGGNLRPDIPTVAPPDPAKVSAQTVERRKEDVPEEPPLPEPPKVVPDPVNIPLPAPVPAPEVAPVPVNVEQVPAPAGLPVPAPVEAIPEPPAAPPVPVPVSRVSFLTSMEPGTQAATLILVFTVIGVWVYANRIVTQWSLLRKAHRGASA